MPKKPKPKSTKRKPGPQADTLVISDPQAAIDAMLGKPTKKG